MRIPFLTVLAAGALTACGSGPAPVTAPQGPPTMAAFRVTQAQTNFLGMSSEPRGSTVVPCAEIRILFALDEIGGVGARIVRQETSVVEKGGAVQPGATVALDVAVPAGGRASLPAQWRACGQPFVDFPVRFETRFTVQDDHGYEQVLTDGVGFSMPIP